MRSKPANEPTFRLTPDSPTPWVHHDNVTIDMELAAAQRVGGILMTKLERSRNAGYDEALRVAGVMDVELTGIDASPESVEHVSAVIDDLKTRIALIAGADSNGRTVRRLAGTRYDGL